jgi:protein subunit release factor B
MQSQSYAQINKQLSAEEELHKQDHEDTEATLDAEDNLDIDVQELDTVRKDVKTTFLETKALDETELVEKFIKGGGKGGQKINKTSNCVWLKHIPTGLEVKCQKTRSLPQNRSAARKIMKEKLMMLFFPQESTTLKRQHKIRRRKQRQRRRYHAKDQPAPESASSPSSPAPPPPSSTIFPPLPPPPHSASTKKKTV